MNRIRNILLAGLLLLLLPLSAIPASNSWSGSGPFATGLGNRIINTLALTPDGQTLYAGSGSGTVLSYDIVPPSLTSLSGTFGTPLTLTASGGTGSGALSYAVANAGSAGCSISGGTSLNATAPGTCTVTVTRAADVNYNLASSAATTVTFGAATQAALTLTSTSGTFGTPLTLTASGGSGTGTLSYAVANAGSAGCSISGGASLNATAAGSCTVTATRAADVNYNLASSAVTTVTFGAATQAALTLTSLSGTFGTPLTLTASGGNGTGALSYSVSDGTAVACVIIGSALSVSSAGTCLVTASKAADSNYLAATSSAATVTLNKASQTTLTVTGPSSVSFGSTGSLTYSGGSGSGAVTFSAGSSSGCSVTGTTLNVTNTSGNCAVTASKGADNNYNAATSASYPVSVNAPVVSLSPPSLTFADQVAGTTSAAQTVTLGNTGNATLSITSILPSIPVFTVTDNCGSSLAAGSSCSLSVKFSPVAAGSRPGSVTLTSNASGSPHSVTVSGNGLASLVPVCSLSAVPARIQPGGSSTLTASCSPAASSYSWTGGTCAGTTLVNSCTGAPAASTSYGVTGINGNGTGAASASVTVTVKPNDLTPILMLLLD